MSQAGIVNSNGSNPQVPTNFVTNSGTSVPIGNTLEVLGTIVNAHGIPLQTTGSGNTVTIQTQYSSASGSSSGTNAGLASFSSTYFTVDANGFVTLNGSAFGQTITGNTGGALSPTAGNWNIFGTSTAAGTIPVQTSGTGSTLTVQVQKSQAVASTNATNVGLAAFNSTYFTVDANGFVSINGAAIGETITGNTGGALSPTAGNWNIVGTGSTTTSGTGSTLTVELTGLTTHSVLIGAGTTTITKVGPTSTSGQVLQSQGATTDPAFSTATYPSTTTINQILYSSASNTIGGVTAGNDGVFISSATGIPSWLANSVTPGFILTANSGAPPSWQSASSSGSVTTLTADTGSATPTAGAIDIAGGTNLNTSATGSTVTINLDNQILQAVGSMSAPSYSFAANANIGMYWTGTEIAFAIAGNNALNFNVGTMSIDTSALFMNPLVTFQSGIQYNYTQPGSYPYSVVHSGNYDYYVSVDTTSARTINLPNTTGTGVTYVIKDRTGNAGTNNITVTTPGGTVTIDGATTYIMNVNFEARQFIFNGTSWEVW